MITVTQNGSLYEIRFPYDPTLIELVKSVPGRWWHPEGKYWSIPLDKLGFLQSRLAQTPYYSQLKIISQEDIGINDTFETVEPATIPDVDLTGIPLYVEKGSKLMSHQKDTLKFEIGRKQSGLVHGFILGDMMGAGKTLQVINLALYNKNIKKAKHCLVVVCINAAKHNWVSDIAKHTNGEYEGYLLGSRLNKKGEVKSDQTGEDKYLDLKTGFKYGNETCGPLPYFLIVNIEAFRYKDKNLKKKKDVFTYEVIHQIEEGNISMIALDEIHRNCLDYDTIIKTDQGYMKIGDIVENCLEVNVLSYDLIHDELVYKPINDWHIYNNTSKLVELSIEDENVIRTIRCTPDHKLYTKNRGWVAAKDLSEFDDIVIRKDETFDN